MHNFDQTLMKDSLIPDTSDRSTESESPSPESPSKRKTNLQLEKMRLGIQGSLFSKGKCSSLSDFRKNSSPIPTSEDTSARQSPENRSPRKLDATRKASYSHSAKERSSIRFLSPTKTAPHKLSASSQDEFNLMEYPLEGSARLTSGDSIADENFFEAFEKNEENALKLCFDPVDEGEKGSKKVNILAEKSVVDEEDDGELSEEETDYLGRKHSVFLVDKDKEIEDLKKELHVTEDSNIYFIQGNFMDYYTEEEILGEGASGVVKKCVKNGTQEYYAVKGVHYRNDDEILVLIIKEFQNHSKLNHKNIIKVYELYIDYFSRKIYTVMELAECDELFESIKNLGHYSEVVASGIFKQILTGINYLHLNGVCHRDIKPNNILVSKDGKVVKITDFNVSKFLDKKSHQYSPLSTTNYKMWTHTGTIAFTAPEVFEGIEYTEAIDMWSAGTVLYTMLCGYQPFQSEYVQDLMELIKSAKYEFHPESWSTISAEAKQLIRWCLDPNCKTRCSPSQALMCPWITSRGMIPDVKIPMKKNHQRIKSIFETRPRGDSSSKAALQVYTTPLEKNQSDFAKRRSSALDCFDFQNYRAKNPTKTPKKPLKILSTFGEVLPESNPQEEEASPQLKKAKSNITERRLMQMRNLMEAIEEPLSLDLEENAEIKKTNKFIKKAKKNMYDDINQDAMETNEVKSGLTDTNCQETMN